MQKKEKSLFSAIWYNGLLQQYWKPIVKIIEKLLYFSNNNHKNVTIHADKLSWKGSNKYVALSILSIYYTWKNIKSNKNVKFKISDST